MIPARSYIVLNKIGRSWSLSTKEVLLLQALVNVPRRTSVQSRLYIVRTYLNRAIRLQKGVVAGKTEPDPSVRSCGPFLCTGALPMGILCGVIAIYNMRELCYLA